MVATVTTSNLIVVYTLQVRWKTINWRGAKMNRRKGIVIVLPRMVVELSCDLQTLKNTPALRGVTFFIRKCLQRTGTGITGWLAVGACGLWVKFWIATQHV